MTVLRLRAGTLLQCARTCTAAAWAWRRSKGFHDASRWLCGQTHNQKKTGSRGCDRAQPSGRKLGEEGKAAPVSVGSAVSSATSRDRSPRSRFDSGGSVNAPQSAAGGPPAVTSSAAGPRRPGRRPEAGLALRSRSVQNRVSPASGDLHAARSATPPSHWRFDGQLTSRVKGIGRSCRSHRCVEDLGRLQPRLPGRGSDGQFQEL